VSWLLAIILRVGGVESISDPISFGKSYLMSSEITGDDYYLGCGGDFNCAIISIASAHAHDGWLVTDNGNGSRGFISKIDHSWALDINQTSLSQTGLRIIANPDITNTLEGQNWGLFSWYVYFSFVIFKLVEARLSILFLWFPPTSNPRPSSEVTILTLKRPDGTYRLHNDFWEANLDVQGNVTPFMNTNTGDTSALLGQRWYFREIAPQVTIKSTITSTTVVNTMASSTVTTTVTTCPVQKVT
jgi:hypothetical protein